MAVSTLEPTSLDIEPTFEGVRQAEIKDDRRILEYEDHQVIVVFWLVHAKLCPAARSWHASF